MLAGLHRFHGLSALRPLYKGGRIVRGKLLSVRYQSRSDDSYRVAVVVSKKVHKSAVVRNRIRRRVYEVIRTGDIHSVRGLDIAVYIYSAEFATMPYNTLTQHIQKLLLKARDSTNTTGKRAIVKPERN